MKGLELWDSVVSNIDERKFVKFFKKKCGLVGKIKASLFQA